MNWYKKGQIEEQETIEDDAIISPEAEENKSLYNNIKIQCNPTTDAWGKPEYTIDGQVFKIFACTIFDAATGGSASIKIGPYWDSVEDGYTNHQITIISWDATPFGQIAEKGLDAQKDYVGKGFGRNVMSKIMEIALDRNISILSIFAPSSDSQRVLQHYTQKGLLKPIASSKAVLADFYTEFMIDSGKASEMTSGEK